MQVVFEEDLDDSEKIAASALPPGLPNLGNTCYLNASVQCMAKVPELTVALKDFARTHPGPSADPGVELVKAMAVVFVMMEQASNTQMIGASVENMVTKVGGLVGCAALPLLYPRAWCV